MVITLILLSVIVLFTTFSLLSFSVMILPIRLCLFLVPLYISNCIYVYDRSSRLRLRLTKFIIRF